MLRNSTFNAFCTTKQNYHLGRKLNNFKTSSKSTLNAWPEREREGKLAMAVEHEFFSNLLHSVHLHSTLSPSSPISTVALLNLFDKAAALNATLCPGHSNCCSCSCRYNCVTPSHSRTLSLLLYCRLPR